MRVELTKEEFVVLLRMPLIWDGPPFHRVPMPKITSADEAVLEEAFKRLKGVGADSVKKHVTRVPTITVDLSEEALRLYVMWLRASLENFQETCTSDLEILVAPRAQVQDCLSKIEILLGL